MESLVVIYATIAVTAIAIMGFMWAILRWLWRLAGEIATFKGYFARMATTQDVVALRQAMDIHTVEGASRARETASELQGINRHLGNINGEVAANTRRSIENAAAVKEFFRRT